MKKRLLTAWIIACMFICLVGQTPITALAEGDDTRVISVPEGLQEVLNYDMPETQTVQTEDTTEDGEVQNGTTDENGEGQGEDAVDETSEGQDANGTDQDGQGEETQTTQDGVQAGQNENAQADQGETVVGDAQNNQNAQGEGSVDGSSETQNDTTIATPENQTTSGDDTSVVTNDTQTVQNETIANGTSENQTDLEENAIEEILEDTETAQEIVETNLTASIIASDGNTYETNVTYTSESGIPMEGVALKVTELVAEDEGYDEYLEESASKVGVDTEDILFSKVFDIKIVDANDENIEYEPTGNVDVSIRVVGMSLDEFENVNVLHFVEDKNDENLLVYDIDTTVSDEMVEFSTDSFSVYVVIGHEGEEVVTPRVMFHFISDNATDCGTYYEGNPYEFINKHSENQTSQILKDGESLELIKDPVNQSTNYFYGWYVVNPYVISGTTDDYGISTSGSKMYYTWPAMPEAIRFESPISIKENNNQAGYYDWSITDDSGLGASGTGSIDEDGNIHVFLAPVFANYNFINFMLYPKVAGQSNQANSLMYRKLVALGSASSVEVKISNIHSNSTDPVHLVFTGWMYNAGTEQAPNWREITTVDSTGAERKNVLVDVNGNEIEDSSKDGVFCTFNLADKTSIDLYPIFVEARWVDFVSGNTGSGASYVPSQFLQSWGDSTPLGTQGINGVNVFTQLPVPTREGYSFDGWYALAVTDPSNGNIINLDPHDPSDPDKDKENVSVEYVDINNKFNTFTQTINTHAIQITDGSGDVVYNGSFLIPGNTQPLFEGDSGELKFYDSLERLKLHAKWKPNESAVTIVYWTENAQEKGYTPSDNVTDTYSANKAVKLTTEQLNDLSYSFDGTRPFESGSTINLSDLANLGLSGVENLEDAVPSGDEIFYELLDSSAVIGKELDNNHQIVDVHPKNSVVISGDGQTVFNVYYNRMTFKLVFHIGRDGYVKNAGNQKTDNNWDSNWIEFMYIDDKVTALGYPHSGGGRKPSPSYEPLDNNEYWYMTYNGKTYTSLYETNSQNVMGYYVPGSDPNNITNDENLYIIEAKYGAYIGDQWPTPTNTAFTFNDLTAENDSKVKTMYTWSAYYGSLYARIANERQTDGNVNFNNPDINGVYEYMSKELCANRAGTGLINDSRVHHLVAYFGEESRHDRYKRYHIMIEAIDGTYDSNRVTIQSGAEFGQSKYSLTTWSLLEINNINEGKPSNYEDITTGGHEFYEADGFPMDSPKDVISNLKPKYQLGWEIEGYDLIYSCFEDKTSATQSNPYDIYFFYRPKLYDLTFRYENRSITDHYYYTQTLENALTNHDNHDHSDPAKIGYEFKGWYTNEAGQGDKVDFESNPAPTMPRHSMVLYPRMDALSYRIEIDPNGGIINHINYDEEDYYHNYANSFVGLDGNTYSLSGTGYNASQSTYFNANYGSIVGQYIIDRDYIELTEKEKNSSEPSELYSGTRYYYVNTQYISENIDGDWGLPPNLRNAVYFTEADLRIYYQYYKKVATDNLGYYTGVTVLDDFDKFTEKYTSFPDHPYRPTDAESYTFMGWYQVFDDGSVASMPYNFNTPVTDGLKLRALWRLEGGYYVQYNPYFFEVDQNGDVTEIVGNLSQWTDPENPTSQNYADQAITQVLQAPDPDSISSGWIFRGWRIVRKTEEGTYEDNGITKPYVIWTPIQLDSTGDPIYYQPGDTFIVDSDFYTEIVGNSKVIHMQAFYQLENESYRRPYVTNLAIDANKDAGGYYNTKDGNEIPALIGPGNRSFNPDPQYLDGANYFTQVLLGDFQSNESIHLNGYSGIMANHNEYLLIGYDEGKDATVAYDKTLAPNGLRSGSPYIPTFATNSVVAVTRDDQRTLYAIWEPMIYVTFFNDTAEDIKIILSDVGTIVNEVDGFDRTALTNEITVPDGGRIKIALPNSTVGSMFTASVKNEHQGKLMSVSGVNPKGRPSIGHNDIPENYQVIYSGELVYDADGIVVTYTETEGPKARVYFDMNVSNGGDTTWTEQNSDYADLTGNGEVYSITKEAIANNHSGQYKPTDPTSTSKIFIGWTANQDVASQTDFSSGTYLIEDVRSNYLYDFSHSLSPDGDLTLYAVWSDVVTVTFDISRTGSSLHTWGGPDTTSTQEPYVFYRYPNTSSEITYTLAKGDRVPKPEDPSTNQNGWNFAKWLLNNNTRRNNGNNDPVIQTASYDFSKRVTEDITLSTSWIDYKPQTFTFFVENQVTNGNVDEEFNYNIVVSEERVWGKLTSGILSEGPPTKKWGSINTKLKSGQQYKVIVTVSYLAKWGGDYCIWIDVIDRDGVVIKSNSVMYCDKNTYHEYVQDYTYNLTISQEEKDGYDTNVTIDKEDADELVNPTDTIEYDPPGSNSFTFHQAQSRNHDRFLPEENTYDAGEKNSLRILFTNQGNSIPAPTSYSTNYKPFFMMFGFGALLVGLIVPPVLMFRRRREEEE